MTDHWYTAWGFWVGVVGASLGVVGIVWGMWARNHPKTSKLACRISESALIQGVPTAAEIRVLIGGYVVPEPHLVKITVTNLGPDELSPAAFAGGYLRFTTKPPRLPDAPLRETMSTLSMLETSTPTRFDHTPEGLAIIMEPCQLKVGEVAVVNLLIAGEPHFECQERLTDFTVKELLGDRPDEFELRLDLPLPLAGAASIPLTWRRRRL